jgi:hypothetical protein
LATIFHVWNPYLEDGLFILLSLNTWQMTNDKWNVGRFDNLLQM